MKVTIAQLIEASEKNGWQWARQTGKVGYNTDLHCATFSCVVGQGLANLKRNARLNEYTFPGATEEVTTGDEELDEAFNTVYSYNDREAKSYADALQFMKDIMAPFADVEITI